MRDTGGYELACKNSTSSDEQRNASLNVCKVKINNINPPFSGRSGKKTHLKLLFSRKRWPFLKSPTDILSFDPVFISQFIAKSSSASFRLQIYPLDLPSCLSLDTSPVGGSIAYKINQIYSCSCVSWLEKGVISIQFYGEKGNRIHASSGSNAMNITRDIFICQ